MYDTRSTSRAGYAQASYQLTDALKLTAGARYTHDFKSESGYYGDLTNNISYSGPQYGSVSTTKTTYHVSLWIGSQNKDEPHFAQNPRRARSEE